MTIFTDNKSPFKQKLLRVKKVALISHSSVSFIDFFIALLFASGKVDIVYCPILNEVIQLANNSFFILSLIAPKYKEGESEGVREPRC